MNISKLNQLIFLQIPIAWVAGVRLKSFTDTQAETTVRLSKMSQNPFNSMFWAVQGMAAEFCTGFMCMHKVKKSGHRISMLVVEQNAKFTKKAVGKITFICEDGEKIDQIIQEAIDTKKGKAIKLISRGYDEAGDLVSEFSFVWSFKLKS